MLCVCVLGRMYIFTPLTSSLCVFCSFVVTTPTITHNTVRALRRPDSPPESGLMSPVPKIETLSLLCEVWVR